MYLTLDCDELTFTCQNNKSQYGYDIASSKESSRDACSKKCRATNECIGFDWDVGSTDCWLSKTPWSLVPPVTRSNRYACELSGKNNYANKSSILRAFFIVVLYLI